MTLSVRTRFEVFKRDRFTCAYCGKHPPEVLLEVDHIVPRAAGGSDELDNLTTACADCNRGKGARMLEEGQAPAINRAAVDELQERVAQAQAYMEALGALQTITDEQVYRVREAWARTFNARVEEKDDGAYWVLPSGGQWPNEKSVRRFLRKLPLAEVLEAVDITASRIGYPDDGACRYFYGVCHGRIRDLNRAEEPVSPPDESMVDSYHHGRSGGTFLENRRIGEILRNYQEHGYASLEDAVFALFPDPD